MIGEPDLLFHIQPPVTLEGILPHTHCTYEIAYFGRGSGTLFFNGEEFVTQMPQLHFCPPRPAWHSFRADGPFVTTSMTVHPELLGPGPPTLADAPRPLEMLMQFAGMKKPLIGLSRATALRVEQIIGLLCEENRLQLEGYLLRVRSLVQELLVLASRAKQGLAIHPTETSQAPAGKRKTASSKIDALSYDKDYRIVKVLDLMRSNSRVPLDNATLAARCGLQEKYLIRLFAREIGMSPQRYYLRLRLEASAQYLAGSPLGIEEIAKKFGFKHRSHFQTAFRQYFKMTPSQYQYIHRSGYRPED